VTIARVKHCGECFRRGVSLSHDHSRVTALFCGKVAIIFMNELPRTWWHKVVEKHVFKPVIIPSVGPYTIVGPVCAVLRDARSRNEEAEKKAINLSPQSFRDT
jgi:hypothetical protein